MRTSQTLSGSDTYSLLCSLRDHPGYRLYLDRLNEAAVEDLNSLRNPSPQDTTNYLRGEINGLERAAQLVNIMIVEEEAEAAKHRQAVEKELRRMEIENNETQFG